MSDINYDKNEPNSLIIGLFVGGTLLILAVIFVTFRIIKIYRVNDCLI